MTILYQFLWPNYRSPQHSVVSEIIASPLKISSRNWSMIIDHVINTILALSFIRYIYIMHIWSLLGFPWPSTICSKPNHCVFCCLKRSFIASSLEIDHHYTIRALSCRMSHEFMMFFLQQYECHMQLHVPHPATINSCQISSKNQLVSKI